MYSEFYCVAEERSRRRRTTSNDAGEIFDLNVEGYLTARWQDQISVTSENNLWKIRPDIRKPDQFLIFKRVTIDIFP